MLKISTDPGAPFPSPSQGSGLHCGWRRPPTEGCSFLPLAMEVPPNRKLIGSQKQLEESPRHSHLSGLRGSPETKSNVPVQCEGSLPFCRLAAPTNTLLRRLGFVRADGQCGRCPAKALLAHWTEPCPQGRLVSFFLTFFFIVDTITHAPIFPSCGSTQPTTPFPLAVTTPLSVSVCYVFG